MTRQDHSYRTGVNRSAIVALRLREERDARLRTLVMALLPAAAILCAASLVISQFPAG